MAVVVFITTYALILPALTLTRDTICGLEEHTHTEDCYTRILKCGQEESEPSDTAVQMSYTAVLTCGQTEHVHDESCYDEDGNLICALEEHVHDESCYLAGEAADGNAPEGHVHTEDCYETVLSCGQDEHTHTEECYAEEETQENETSSEAEETEETEETVPAISIPVTQKTEETEEPEETQDIPEEQETSEEQGSSELESTVITADGETYKICVTYGPEAGIPEGAELRVRELTEEDPEYIEYYSGAANEVENGKSSITFARFFDIEIWADDGKIEPEGPVTVSILLQDAPKEVEDDLTIVHFAEDGTEIIDKTEQAESIFTEEELEDGTELNFEADSFSVYGVVATIEKTVLASDGHNYRITVSYSADTGIPDNAELKVSEITEESELYEEYLFKAERSLGIEDAEYIRLFDIKIVDSEDSRIKYQPAEGSTVDVKIALDDAESSDLGVVHFADGADRGSVIEAEIEGQLVSFEANGFSIYVVAETGHYSRIGYRFYNADGSLLGLQYVKKYVDPDTGETEYETLYDPGFIPEYGQIFIGWAFSEGETDPSKIYTLDELNLRVEAELNDDTIPDDTIREMYPIMEEAWYLRYIDVESDGTVKVLKYVRVPKDAEDKTIEIDYAPEIPEGTHYEGWYDPVENHAYSLNLYQEPPVTDSIVLDHHLDLYLKLDNRAWLVFDSNAGGPGSNATYTPPQMLYTNATPAQITVKPNDPTWKGYQFTGWNTAPDGSGEDWLKVESRTYDENGHLVDVQYSVNKFGETISEDVILYAQWEANDNFYRVAYWRQKESDAISLDDSAKKYDFYGYREISSDIKTGQTVSATNNDRNMAWVAQQLSKTLGDENKFTFNSANSDTGSKTVAGDGSTVFNMYFDRVEMTFIFDSSFDWYTETTDTASGDIYGYINGEYVLLNRGDAVTTHTYSFAQTYTPNTQEAETRYGLFNGDYELLTRQSYVTLDGETEEYTGTRYNITTGDTVPQYGIVNGRVVQLERREQGGCNGGYYWVYGNNQRYEGVRYLQSNNGTYGFDPASGTMKTLSERYTYVLNGETYTGTRYVQANGGSEYTGTRYDGINGNVVTEHTGTQYGIDANGGYVRLNRETTTSYAFTYEDENGDPQVYSGTFYKRGSTDRITGLYGSQMKAGEWPTGTWRYASSGASSYNAGSNNNANNRTTLNAPWTSYTISNGAYEYNHGTAPYTTWHLYGSTLPTGVNVVYWRQNTEGTYSAADRLQTTGGNGNTLYIADDKFYAFTMYGYEYGGTGGTPNSSNNSGQYGWHDLTDGQTVSLEMQSGHGDINIYYQRDKFNVIFQSNDAGSTVKTYPEGVFYQKNLGFLKDYYTPADEDGRDGYFFAGWYKDANFTKPFDFENEEMPHNDLILYGKWDTYRVRIVLVPTPNGWHDDEVFFPNNQRTTFRLDYNESISDANINSTVAKRTGYKLVGWYTTPDFQDGSEWNFSTHINSSVSAVNMNYQETADWEDNVYGDNDGAHDNVEGIIKLYAKWQFDFDESDLFIEYEVPESYVIRDALGELITEIPQDETKYTYLSTGTYIYAQIKGAPENYIDAFDFVGWELLNSSGLETGIILGPDTYSGDEDVNPLVQFRDVTDDSGEVRTMKVIVLRGVFTKNSTNKSTVVTFDGNGGATADNESATRTITLLVNEDFIIPGETGANAFVREGYDLIGWSFNSETTPAQFAAALAAADGDAHEFAVAGMFEAGIKVAADNLTLSELNNWDPLANTIYAVWQPHVFTVKITKVVDGESVSNKEFTFTAEGLNFENNTLTLVNGQSETAEDIAYGTQFTLTETVPVGYAVESVEAIQTSDANGVALDTPIDLEGADGKTYEVKGNIEITYTNKLIGIPVILEKVGFDNTAEDPSEYPLSGAKFTVYTSQTGSEIAKDINGTELKDLETNSDGLFYNGILATGTYFLEETVVPDGYDPPAGRFKLIVSQEQVTLTATWITGSEGGLAGTVTKVTDADTGIDTYTVTVRNLTGYILPEAGGAGTTVFYASGLMMFGASWILLMKRRKKSE